MNATHAVVLSSLAALALASAAGAQFAPAASYVSNNPSKIDQGDLDGDGDPDLITTNVDGNCWTYLNTSGAFALGPMLLQPGVPVDVKVADFDGVADLDYVAVVSPTQIAVHLSNGAWPAFLPATTYAVTNSAIEVEVADFDYDDDTDIAVLSQTPIGGFIEIFANDGAGSFSSVWSTATVEVPTGFCAGNLTSRRSKDLIYCGGTNVVCTLISTSTSPLTFGPPTCYPVDMRPSGVTTGDFNGDGYQDVACTSGNPSGVATSVLLNVGATAAGWPNAAALNPYVPYSIPGTAVYFGIAAEDFDCDGDLDLALASPGSALVGVLSNDGTGVFGSPMTHPTGTLCTDVVAANFDGRLPDAASANVNDISVLINTLPYGECEHVFIGGIRDNFVNPLPNTVEDVCPSPQLDGFLGALPRSDFDDTSVNRHFGHSFVNLPGNILRATIRVQWRANGSANNDSFGIGLDVAGGAYVSNRRISLQTGLPWNTGDTATIVFDLEEMPGCVDIMRKMQADGRLDFRVQDDTMIDYLELRITTCSTAGNLATETLDHTPMVAFNPVTFTTTAAPGDVALFYLDLVVGAGPVVAPYGAFCLPGPTYLSFALESGGTADLTVPWPPLPPCLTISYQALVVTPSPLDARFSNTMTQQTFF